MARLLHLSDLHLTERDARASGRLDTCATLEQAIGTILDRMTQNGPFDAVLVTGDVSDDGSEESYSIACQQLERLALPVLAVPGNHDLRTPFRNAFRQWMDLSDTGPLDWAVNLDDTCVIGLDTLIEGQGGGRLCEESLAHLSRAIKDAGARQIVVALHHPPLRTGIRFMDAIGLENTHRLAEVMKQALTPVRILAGHVHSVFHGFLGVHSVVTAPSVCSAFALDCREDAPVGFWTEPTGYAVLDTAPGGTWAAVPLAQGAGPFRF